MNDLSTRYTAAKRRLFDAYYSELNPEQRRAVFTINGPLLVLAGAGSGKTTVLVKRIAYMIKYGNAYFSERVPNDLTEEHVAALEAAATLPPDQLKDILPEFIDDPCPPYRVLAITFTNKAANEIKQRLAASFDAMDASEIWAGTFHSICMRILRNNVTEAGLAPGFSIYDADDSKRAVSAAMKRCNIDEKTLPIKSVMNEISKAKDRLVDADAYMAEVGSDYRLKQIARIYKEYQEGLKNANALDFDDIIFRTVMLLRNEPELREKYQRRFRYVSVDEYQDTNQAQFALTALLSDGYRNLMVVGDDDQSIYRFRGATIANILGFDRSYSDAVVIKLERNYRSTGNILGAANGIICHNKGRHNKKLWTDHAIGEPITIREVDDQSAEARFIAETISREVKEAKRHCRDYAVLYRTNAQSATLESAFAKAGVPYRTLGSIRFFDRKEIRDIIAYLHILNNPADSERLKRIINEPKRKIGEKTVADIERLARDEGVTMLDIIAHANRYVELTRVTEPLKRFSALVDSLRTLADEVTLDELVRNVFEMTGYHQMLISGGEAERDRIENIEELVSGAAEYQQSSEEPTLTGYLEEVALVSDVDKYDENADAVILMTIHSAKGLEFPVVFIPGMEDGIFPGMKTITGPDDEMEEERRLAYVAVTRAKEKLYILCAHDRLMWGRSSHNPPSRFIEEIPPQYVERQKRERPEGTRPQMRPYGRTYYSERAEHAERKKMAGGDITVNKQPLHASTAPLEKIEAGDRVRHRIFGDGEVLTVRSMGADVLYEVVFDKVGTKKLLATYAKLTKI